ncbi:S9 family peptidase [Myroides odoratimimus]|uniref:S9 family peptidase n=1 Tax=Myroides TaxID=76831 RepID=UPI0008F54CE7|nr:MULTISPECIES: S9 family peptidase [Myroides]APA92024.1 S9 family peptidase [Myroides sp. ZB35]MCS7471945.1 S9 family peptidase [Myroides odoratimimus]MDM1038695.1 S9 family peptidase [Myroides odoratimimus]MDM1052863.1 S9 family peptidase [Myroides odoratimimus]MDM1413365.1 S9 family peptidase [Myroides odoratimimus]
MKHLNLTLLFCIIATQIGLAQKQIAQEEIWNGTFRTKVMQSVNSMEKSNQYSRIERVAKDHQEINLYNFETLEKAKTIFSTSAFKDIKSIDTYIFDHKEEQLLIGTNTTPIYRRSALTDFYLFNPTKNSLVKIADHKISEPTFSNDGSKIAYAYQNNLYIYDIASQKTQQITHDGKKNHIINGISDWVYEEEFGIVRMFDWNKNGDKIAYIKFDETDVPEYSMDVYGTGLYPTQDKFKYPKAGEKNSLVSIHIYDVKSNQTSKVDLSEFNDFYIPRIKWTNDNQYLSAQIINRHQNDLKVFFIDGNTLSKKLILNETDKAYVDVATLSFLDNNDFVWLSERDGHNHLYYYNKEGKLVNQITKGNWEVTDYYGIDTKSKKLYFQSVEEGSIYRGVYSIDLNGKNKKKLSEKLGTNRAIFSPNFEQFINVYSSSTVAPTYTLQQSKTGKVVKEILNNKELESKLVDYNLPTKEFIQIPTVNGLQLNAWVMKPKDFDPAKKYPVFMYQYSGPGSQQVADKWLDSNDYWHAMLTQKGYIVVTVDGRGTGFRGAEFKKMTQNQLGRYEVDDQIIAAKYLGQQSYVDASRIGIWGWSYGGFMSSNAILQGNDVFKLAIAVAPVINWRYYDSIYTERYMTTPQENQAGYDDNSPITHASKLKGRYLLVHGTADDNVHVQNAMTMIEALVQENKDFDWLIYPDKNHGISGGNTRLQLYTKMTNFILNNL